MEMVSNVSTHFFRDNTLVANFLTDQMNLENQWEVAVWEVSYPSMYQNFAAVTFVFFDTKLSNSSELYYVECFLQPSTTATVGTMNTFIQERHNHSEICIIVKKSRGTKTVEIYPANEGCVFALFSMALGHFSEVNVGSEFWLMLREKGPQNTKICLRKCWDTLSHGIHGPWRHERPIAALIFFHS